MHRCIPKASIVALQETIKTECQKLVNEVANLKNHYQAHGRCLDHTSSAQNITDNYLEAGIENRSRASNGVNEKPQGEYPVPPLKLVDPNSLVAANVRYPHGMFFSTSSASLTSIPPFFIEFGSTANPLPALPSSQLIVHTQFADGTLRKLFNLYSAVPRAPGDALPTTVVLSNDGGSWYAFADGYPTTSNQVLLIESTTTLNTLECTPIQGFTGPSVGHKWLVSGVAGPFTQYNIPSPVESPADPWENPFDAGPCTPEQTFTAALEGCAKSASASPTPQPPTYLNTLAQTTIGWYNASGTDALKTSPHAGKQKPAGPSYWEFHIASGSRAAGVGNPPERVQVLVDASTPGDCVPIVFQADSGSVTFTPMPEASKWASWESLDRSADFAFLNTSPTARKYAIRRSAAGIQALVFNGVPVSRPADQPSALSVLPGLTCMTFFNTYLWGKTGTPPTLSAIWIEVYNVAFGTVVYMPPDPNFLETLLPNKPVQVSLNAIKNRGLALPITRAVPRLLPGPAYAYDSTWGVFFGRFITFIDPAPLPFKPPYGQCNNRYGPCPSPAFALDFGLVDGVWRVRLLGWYWDQFATSRWGQTATDLSISEVEGSMNAWKVSTTHDNQDWFFMSKYNADGPANQHINKTGGGLSQLIIQPLLFAFNALGSAPLLFNALPLSYPVTVVPNLVPSSDEGVDPQVFFGPSPGFEIGGAPAQDWLDIGVSFKIVTPSWATASGSPPPWPYFITFRRATATTYEPTIYFNIYSPESLPSNALLLKETLPVKPTSESENYDWPVTNSSTGERWGRESQVPTWVVQYQDKSRTDARLSQNAITINVSDPMPTMWMGVNGTTTLTFWWNSARKDKAYVVLHSLSTGCLKYEYYCGGNGANWFIN